MAQFDAKNSENLVFKGMDDAEVNDIVTTFNQIGPKTREIFSTQKDYKLYLDMVLPSVDEVFSDNNC